MASGRALTPPRNLDPQLRLQSQIVELHERLLLLERNSGVSTQRLSSGATSFTIDVPASANLVTVDFELLCSPNAEVLLRPNGSTGTIVTDILSTSSTVSANTITAPTGTQASLTGGRFIASTHASTGFSSSVGTLQVQLRAGTPGRRNWNAVVRTSNTSGPSNFYTYTWIVGGTVDSIIGISTAITTLQMACSTGSFSAGTVKATFT